MPNTVLDKYTKNYVLYYHIKKEVMCTKYVLACHCDSPYDYEVL